ncbi:cyclase family protein [Amycolatopsis nivea]
MTPSIGELLAGSPDNWGRWGPDDEVGALNYLTRQEVLRGAAEIKTGETIVLQRLIGDPDGDPVSASRTPARHTMTVDESSWDPGGTAPAFPGGLHYADDKIDAYLQGSTQYDALGHVWYDGALWNGYDARTTVGGLRKAGIDPIARRGIAGRAVLLDLPRWRGKTRLDPGELFDHHDLEACAESQGTVLERHDILVLRTNYLSRTPRQGNDPGLEFSFALLEWFQDKEIPNLVTDTFANEPPVDRHSGCALPLHCSLMRNLGVVFAELCDLERLASACAGDGRYEFFYVAAPLRVHRAAGSPVNPVAIR